jgi:hypothetical protein
MASFINCPFVVRNRSSSFHLYMSSSSSSSNNPLDQAKQWQEQAQRLRDEIAALEAVKANMKEQEQKVAQAELDTKRDYLERYSVVIPILKPNGMTVKEPITFPPRFNADVNPSSTSSPSPSNDTVGSTICSTILTRQASLPLGMILREHETLVGMTVVHEILPDSNAARGGIQEGDLLRAVTACQMEMDQSSTWQLLVGGIGRPKTVRFMYSVDYTEFERVLQAVASNRMDPEGRSVLLVLERRQGEM